MLALPYQFSSEVYSAGSKADSVKDWVLEVQARNGRFLVKSGCGASAFRVGVPACLLGPLYGQDGSRLGEPFWGGCIFSAGLDCVTVLPGKSVELAGCEVRLGCFCVVCCMETIPMDLQRTQLEPNRLDQTGLICG